MRDLVAQNIVGGQSDGVEVTRFFQPRIDRGDRIGGVGLEETAPKVAASVAENDGVENIPPALGTVTRRW